MDRDTSGLFNRSELPQGAASERPALAPIGAGADDDEEPKRPDTLPRLAVDAKASNAGSGLIDLDAVARDIEKNSSKAVSAPARRLAPVVDPPPPFDAAGDASASDSLPAARPTRHLLLASIGLLVVLIGLLGYLATR